ncbi:MAG: diacylglycerol kinase family protein [candidate division WWE3 bacterium]|nr:diacylglycerol kinase family protein [candidate division WWE3 bacterium]
MRTGHAPSSVITSFKNAWNGLVYTFKTQPNFKIHCFAALAVTALTLILKVNLDKYLVLLIMVVLVMTAELFNTSLEATTDAHKLIKKTPEEDRLIGVAKDVAAGAVLVTAIGAVVVGLLIFLPYILSFRA